MTGVRLAVGPTFNDHRCSNLRSPLPVGPHEPAFKSAPSRTQQNAEMKKHQTLVASTQPQSPSPQAPSSSQLFLCEKGHPFPLSKKDPGLRQTVWKLEMMKSRAMALTASARRERASVQNPKPDAQTSQAWTGWYCFGSPTNGKESEN